LADSANLHRQSANFNSMVTSFPDSYYQFADTATFDVAFSARWQNLPKGDWLLAFKQFL
jgi:hypothetical protein